MTELLIMCVGGSCQYKHSCKRYLFLEKDDEKFEQPPLKLNKRKRLVCDMFYGTTHARDVVYFKRVCGNKRTRIRPNITKTPKC